MKRRRIEERLRRKISGFSAKIAGRPDVYLGGFGRPFCLMPNIAWPSNDRHTRRLGRTGQKALLIDSTSDLARPLVDPRGPRLFIAGRLRSLLFVCTLDFKVPIEIYELFHVCFQLAFERRPA
jgi:hypothetical protein